MNQCCTELTATYVQTLDSWSLWADVYNELSFRRVSAPRPDNLRQPRPHQVGTARLLTAAYHSIIALNSHSITTSLSLAAWQPHNLQDWQPRNCQNWQSHSWQPQNWQSQRLTTRVLTTSQPSSISLTVWPHSLTAWQPDNFTTPRYQSLLTLQPDLSACQSQILMIPKPDKLTD